MAAGVYAMLILRHFMPRAIASLFADYSAYAMPRCHCYDAIARSRLRRFSALLVSMPTPYLPHADSAAPPWL